VTYDDAAAELYKAPHDEFVAERKRLAAALKSDDDKAGAAKLAKLTRPPISAWTVNQLWWHARATFDDLLETGEQLRAGKLKAMTAHREAVAKLRAKAQSILTDAGNAATEATLRRITTTLAAIAATGGFDPDEPGMLSADRDPPGFEAAGIPMAADDDADEEPAVAPKSAEPTRAKKRDADEEPGGAKQHDGDDELAAARAKKRDAAAAAERDRAAAAIERRKAEQDRARRLQERHRLEAALRTAVGDVERREREVARLGEALAEAETAVEKARAIANDLESQLASLDA
jgi:hypothetical protein